MQSQSKESHAGMITDFTVALEQRSAPVVEYSKKQVTLQNDQSLLLLASKALLEKLQTCWCNIGHSGWRETIQIGLTILLLLCVAQQPKKLCCLSWVYQPRRVYFHLEAAISPQALW